MSFIDPSWCARITAHRAAPPPEPVPLPAAAEPPAPRKRREIPSVHVCERCGTPVEARLWCPTCSRSLDEPEAENLRFL